MSTKYEQKSLYAAVVVGLMVLMIFTGATLGSSITLEGTTTGAFPPNVSGLMFTGGNFSWITDTDGNASVSLGTLNWVSGAVYQVDNALIATVTFNDPAGTPISQTFTADIWSSWNGSNGFGDVWFDDINPTHFTFTIPSGSGSFDLGIAGTRSNRKSRGAGDIFVPHRWFNLPYHGSVQVMAMITNATFTPIPEPTSIAVLLAGGLGMWFRRRNIG